MASQTDALHGDLLTSLLEATLINLLSNVQVSFILALVQYRQFQSERKNMFDHVTVWKLVYSCSNLFVPSFLDHLQTFLFSELNLFAWVGSGSIIDVF